MQISKINSQMNYYRQTEASNHKGEFSITNNIKNQKVEDNRVTNPAIWDELAQKYDITNASFNEVCTISRKLYDVKQISLADLGSLTLVEKMTAKLKENFGYNNSPLLTSEKSANNWEEEKINWIKEYKAKIELNMKNGNLTGYNHNKEIVSFLKRLA